MFLRQFVYVSVGGKKILIISRCTVRTLMWKQKPRCLLKSLRAANHVTTKSMEQSPFWETNSSPASLGIPHILWNTKVHCRIHKNQPPVPLLSHINRLQVSPSHLLKIHVLSSQLHIGPLSGLFPSASPTKPCKFLLPLPYVKHARQSHSSWFYHRWGGVRSIKLHVISRNNNNNNYYYYYY